MEILNTVVGLVALVLAAFTIWFSLYLYTKSKDSEKESAKTLEGIRAQTDALQKLTGRWMDRLTRYATEPRPADEGLMMLVNTMANLPTTILTHLRIQTTTGPTPSNDALLNELVDCYIALYYYTAIANVVAQVLLPGPEDFNVAVPAHANIQRIVDRTYDDFVFMARIIERVDQARLQASQYSHLLREAQANWRPLVRNTELVQASRRQG